MLEINCLKTDPIVVNYDLAFPIVVTTVGHLLKQTNHYDFIPVAKTIHNRRSNNGVHIFLFGTSVWQNKLINQREE